MRLELRPGDYIVKGRPLATVHPASRVDDVFAKHLNDAFSLGEQRTAPQDIEFAINQLVEIAVRALSPGINDPFTAMTCVDRLDSGAVAAGAVRHAVALSARRRRHTARDRPAGHVPGIVDAALDQIRQHARQNAAVTLRLLETIEVRRRQRANGRRIGPRCGARPT